MNRSPLFPAALAALALACSDAPDGPGQLSVALSAPASTAAAAAAAPLPGVEAIWVNVVAVRAHSPEAGWVTLDAAPVRLDLLALAGAGVDLGLASLPAGRVTQLRLVVDPVGNTVVKEGQELPLFVPSGDRSGIKINGPWTVDACDETALTLELDGHRSIWAHPTGQGEEWILRPVIRTARVVQEPGTCDPEPPACAPEECPSGLCDASGACAPGGAYTPCAADAECLSNACVEASCAPGGEGAPCRGAEDCAEPLGCVEAVCAPASLPAL